MITAAIQQLLWSDPDVRNRFATCDFGTTVEMPAIFLTEIPEGVHFPCAFIRQRGGSRYVDRGRRGWEVDIDIHLLGDKVYTDKSLHALAWDIVLALDREHLSIDGWEEVGVEVEAPQYDLDEDGFPEYTIPVQVRVIHIE